MITAVETEDFTYDITVGEVFFGSVRELCPKDLYYIECLKKENGGEDLLQVEFFLEMMSRLSDFDMDRIMNMGVGEFRYLMNWFAKEILEGKLMGVYQFLEIAFHLCKQRWDSSVDWLEQQPMSKVLTMVDITTKHAERQNSEMKKSSRRK